MLLAKIKEKLFNRRNTIIVESLEGDLDFNGNIKAKNVVNTVVVSNIKQISDEILSSLKAGDIVQKEDSSGIHSYIVSFKKDGTGICLTYTDASIVETQSYDYTDGHWLYNSEDKMPLVNVEDASSGAIVYALGLDEDGKLVKGSAGGKLYLHVINISRTSSGYGFNIDLHIYSNKSTAYTKSSFFIAFKGKTFAPQKINSVRTSGGGDVTSLCTRFELSITSDFNYTSNAYYLLIENSVVTNTSLISRSGSTGDIQSFTDTVTEL